MKQLNTYNAKELEEMTLAELTIYSNTIAVEISSKPTKRFATKPKAIAKINKIFPFYRELYAEWFKEAKSDKKVKKPSKRIEGCLITTDSKTKEGSIIEAIYKAINDEMCCTVQEVIDNVVANYERPRSGQPVTDSFVYSTITWCITNGKLNVSK